MKRTMPCYAKHMAPELRKLGRTPPSDDGDVVRDFFRHVVPGRSPADVYCVHDQKNKGVAKDWSPGDLVTFVEQKSRAPCVTATLVRVVERGQAPMAMPPLCAECPRHLELKDVTILP